ncbi:hypothetical protein CDAR_463831 [Caerostris darwini]|uniref:Uncharacterized protein n=1 Tax=Caerostris darwini TaxID=1538125 RepID=A0AAV4RZN7_9ARAC|nr:hypothetical protein CDAR_463831 [Caerostris darwini]
MFPQDAEISSRKNGRPLHLILLFIISRWPRPSIVVKIAYLDYETDALPIALPWLNDGCVTKWVGGKGYKGCSHAQWMGWSAQMSSAPGWKNDSGKGPTTKKLRKYYYKL